MQVRKREQAAPPPADDPLEFVMSDGSVDRMGDVIEPDGWQLDRFRKNPVALFGHDPGFPIGRWSDVGVRKGELTGRLELMEPVSERLREIHTAVQAGVLRAVSVGFHSDSFEPLGKGGGLRFTEAELVECSLVSVPANPNALAVARSLGLSRETRALIFGATADLDQPASGSPGAPAVAQFAKSGTTRMNYAERIQAAQQEVVGLQDQLAALPDVEDVAKVGELTTKIGEVKNKIFAWVEAEKALGNEAAPITVPKERIQVFRPTEPLPATAPKVWAQPKRKETPVEDHILRHFAATTIAYVKRMPVEMALAELYGSYGDFEATKGIVEWRTRAATAPATTTTAGWAAELAVTGQGAWFNALMAGSIFQPVASRGMNITLGRYAQISMPTRQATPTVAGSFVAEGAPIPVRQAAFTAVTLGLKKMAVITSYTREIAEHSTPEIETILRQLIMDDTGVAVDTVFIDATAASSIRPAGIRSGVAGLTPTAITGGAFAALVTDLKNMVGALAAVNAMGQLVFIMNPVQQIAISLTQNAGGDFPFQAEINSNRLLGYPVIVSSTVPANTVILINADDLMVVQGDTPRFDVSDQATLHFEDTTPLQIGTAGSPATVAAPTRSMFQTDSLALRMILPMNWAMRRTGSVAWIAGVTW
ncbi:MAG TPA: phage major capsid protein [Vineibacter sp.]|nr:phage major capsid protein [Vineibacter sp.]